MRAACKPLILLGFHRSFNDTRTKAISRLTGGFFVVISMFSRQFWSCEQLFHAQIRRLACSCFADRNESIMNGGREANPFAAILQQKSIMYMNRHKFFVGQNRKFYLAYLYILTLSAFAHSSSSTSSFSFTISD